MERRQLPLQGHYKQQQQGDISHHSHYQYYEQEARLPSTYRCTRPHSSSSSSSSSSLYYYHDQHSFAKTTSSSSSSSADSYNVFGTPLTTASSLYRGSGGSRGNNNESVEVQEYWTNGKTTHLMVSDPPPPPVVLESSSSSHPNHLHSAPKRMMTAAATASSNIAYPHYLAGSSFSSPSDQQQEVPKTSSPLSTRDVARNSLLAGSISGMVSTAALYPLDVLRTKLQAQQQQQQHHHHSRGSIGPLAVLRQTLQYGGIRALYTGLTLPLAAQAVYKGTVFTVHNVTQAWLLDLKTLERHKFGVGIIVTNTTTGSSKAATTTAPKDVVSLTVADTALCGFVAGAVNAGLFVTPVELVRNQLIAQDSKLAAAAEQAAAAAAATSTAAAPRVASGTVKNGTWDVIRFAVNKNGGGGLTRLWRGVGMSILRDGVGVAAFFSAKRIVETSLMNMNEQYYGDPTTAKPTFGTSVLAGAMAGLAYWIVSLPLDTMKTWVQSGDLQQPAVSVRRELQQLYQSSNGDLWHVGHRLLRGWQVAYGRGIPSAAITIAVYSSAYQALTETT